MFKIDLSRWSLVLKHAWKQSDQQYLLAEDALKDNIKMQKQYYFQAASIAEKEEVLIRLQAG